MFAGAVVVVPASDRGETQCHEELLFFVGYCNLSARQHEQSSVWCIRTIRDRRAWMLTSGDLLRRFGDSLL